MEFSFGEVEHSSFSGRFDMLTYPLVAHGEIGRRAGTLSSVISPREISCLKKPRRNGSISVIVSLGVMFLFNRARAGTVSYIVAPKEISLLFLRRFTWSWIAQMIRTCEFHPGVAEIFKFLKQLDKVESLSKSVNAHTKK